MSGSGGRFPDEAGDPSTLGRINPAIGGAAGGPMGGGGDGRNAMKKDMMHDAPLGKPEGIGRASPPRGGGGHYGRGGQMGGGGGGRFGGDDQRPSLPEPPKKKFTNRCRLFIGNLPMDLKESELKDMLGKYGELSELYLSGKGFAFARLVSLKLQYPLSS